MGINVSGIVINKNLENNVAELAELLKLNLSFEKEVDFETASQNNKDEAILDVYYSSKGTLAFANVDCLQEENKYPKTKVLTFSVEESAMKFSFNYSENNKSIRYVMELEGELVDDEGEELEIEERSTHIAETIWKQINRMLGESYWKIAPTEKAYRFQIKPYSTAEAETPATTATAQSQTTSKVLDPETPATAATAQSQTTSKVLAHETPATAATGQSPAKSKVLNPETSATAPTAATAQSPAKTKLLDPETPATAAADKSPAKPKKQTKVWWAFWK